MTEKDLMKKVEELEARLRRLENSSPGFEYLRSRVRMTRTVEEQKRLIREWNRKCKKKVS